MSIILSVMSNIRSWHTVATEALLSSICGILKCCLNNMLKSSWGSHGRNHTSIWALFVDLLQQNKRHLFKMWYINKFWVNSKPINNKMFSYKPRLCKINRALRNCNQIFKLLENWCHSVQRTVLFWTYKWTASACR